MQTLGRTFGILSMIGMLLGMVPFLGWLNWFNIPLAIVGLVISIIGKSNGGMIICGLAVLFGMLRLLMGGGII